MQNIIGFGRYSLRSRSEEIKASAKYAKIVEWSEEDQCYVGSAPGLILAGCHGDDEKKVFDELCQIVEEPIELYTKDGKPLPPPTSGRDFATKMQNVA
jgi:predicted RNase H-like HicB family nuclease